MGGKGPSKGANFEREVCKILSLWFTQGKRDDIFWRTSGSGARAKTRMKQGMKTFGQYGDVQATDPIGQPLIDLCIIEIKRGYGSVSCSDAIDVPINKNTIWREWISKLEKDRKEAGVPFWLLITKRNRRETIVFMPRQFRNYLTPSRIHKTFPHVILNVKGIRIYGAPLKPFLKSINPKVLHG